MTPRIAWCNTIRYTKLLGKATVGMMACLALAYGIREAMQRTFLENPDFRLQEIRLNENNVVDEETLVDSLSIDLSKSIFQFKVSELSEKLNQNPALVSATVTRELPGTLIFEVAARKPIAWLAVDTQNAHRTRRVGSSLIDQNGYVYPCPSGQLALATQLPVLIVDETAEPLLDDAGVVIHPSYRDYSSLLTMFRKDFPADLAEIDTFSRDNLWSIKVTTHSGTEATFGLRNHERQLEKLRQALHHAHQKSYKIHTINLIPERNVPITIDGEAPPPRAIPVFEEPSLGNQAHHAESDVRKLLNRN